MKNILTTLLVILNSTFFILNSNAANRFWVASSTADWNSTANWSTTSGGSGGASVPGSSDVAKFDGNGTGNCTINATVNVAGIDIASGYSGTIAQGGYSVTVGTSHFAQAGGTWTGGSAKIDVNGGNLTVSGGTFTSTSDTLFVGGSLCGTVTQFNHSGGTFSHNNGAVVFDASGCWPTTQILNVISTTLFNDLVLKPGSSWINVNTASGDTVKAERNIVHLAGTLGGVAFSLQGNFSLGASTGGGSAQVIFAGTANQTYAYTTGGRTAYVVVNKSGGTLSPASGTTAFSSQGFKLLSGTFTAPPGDFFTGGNICSSLAAFTHSGGTFAHNNGRVVLDAYGCWGSSITLDVITATTFYDVKINAAMGSLFPVNIASGDTVKVDNKMEHDGGIINSGCWMLKGNLSIGSSSGGGAAQLIFTGTANQTYTCTTGRTCAVTINKTAGSVTPASGTTAFGVQGFKLLAGSFTAPTGNFKVGGSYCGTMYFTHSSGTFTHNNGTVVFDPSGCWHSYLNIDVLPATAFYNATFSANGSVSVVLTSGDSIDTQHNLILTSCYEMNNALLAPQGNVTVGSAWGTASTTPLLFCGNSDQNFDLTGGTDRFNGSVKIKKTGGKVNLLSAATLDASSQTLTFVKGNIASTSSNLLTLGDNVTVSGASDSSYVDGPIKKTGNDAFTFPTGAPSGSPEGGGHYRPISISAPASTGDAFTAQYFLQNSNDTYSHSAKDGTLAELSRNEYWNLARTTGTSNVSVTLSIDSATSCSVDNLSNLKVAAWDGSTWKDKGNGGTSGNVYVGTVVSSAASSTFGAYGVGTSTGFECEPGISCLDVIDLETGDTCLEGVTITARERWYSFIADSINMSITLENTSLPGNEVFLEIFVNCDSSLLEMDTLYFNQNSSGIDLSNLTINQSYLVKISANDINTHINICIEPRAAGFNLLYETEGCGLNYAQSSARLNKRTNLDATPQTLEGETMPVTLNIDIPTGSIIDKAFIWITGVGSHLTQSISDNTIDCSLTTPNNNVTNFTTTYKRQTDAHDCTCWSIPVSGENFSTNENLTFTYSYDATSLIDPNDYNGDYEFNYSGLIENHFDLNGVTLFIIYKNCEDNANRSRIKLYHGITVKRGSDAAFNFNFPLTMNVNTFNSNVDERGFMIVNDVEQSGTSSEINSNAQSISANMYNFMEGTASSVNGLPSIRYKVLPNGNDCYAVSVMGFICSDAENQCSQLSVDAGTDIGICPGGSAQLAADGDGGFADDYEYSWTPEEGLSDPTIENPTASPSQTTVYTVTISNSQGCSATDNVTITLYDSPPAPVIEGDVFGCTIDPVYTISNFDDDNIYTWIPDANTDLTPPSPSDGSWMTATLYSEGGSFTVNVIDENGCEAETTFDYYPCCDPGTDIDFSYSSSSDVIANYSSLINSTGPIPVFTNTGTPPNPVYINGVFTIDVDFGFDGQEVLLGPDAKIIVEDGKIFLITQASYLHTCERLYMWDGIYLDDPNSRIEISGSSRLEEAKNAVVCENGAQIDISNSLFNVNHTDISISNFSSNYTANIAGSSFTCDADLIAPYSGNRSDIGINVVNITGNITIGNTSSVNTFDNHNTGIRVERSEVEIYNNVFQNMALAQGQNTKAGIWVHGNPGIGGNNLVTIGGTGTSEKNEFNDVFRGILLEQMASADVLNNSFNNNSECIYVYRCYNQNTINIEGNELTNSSSGIRCYRNIQSTINIEENNLHDMKSWSSGITLKELNPYHNSAYYTVYNNDITEVRRGVQAYNLKKPLIDNNTIEYKPTSSASFISRGIEIYGCYGPKVSNNTINAVAAITDQNHQWVGGIYITGSSAAFVNCNNTEDAGYGIQFNGPYRATIFNNNMRDNQTTGFWLNNNGIVGTQYNPFPATGYPTPQPSYNDWYNNDWSDTYASGSLGYETNGALSPFYIRSSPSSQNPQNNLAQVGSVAVTMFTQNNSPTLGPACTSAPVGKMLDGAHDIVLGSIDYIDNEENARWLDKQGLYYNLVLDSIDYSSDSLISAFVDSVESSSLGELTQMGFYLEQPDEWDKMQTWNSSPTYINDIEENHRAIFDIATTELESETGLLTDTTTINELRELAVKCPFTDGLAVYQARAMLAPYDSIGTVYLNICEVEDNPSEKWEGEEDNTTITPDVMQERYFRLYPNPNDGYMQLDYILFDDEIALFNLFDVTGRHVRNYLLNGQNGTLRINEQELRKGIYYYRVSVNEETVISEKIVIIK